VPGCGVEGSAALSDQGMVLVGHSMGATIAPLTAAAQPRFRAMVLSGAGGSYLHNVVYKQSPLEVRPLAEAMLNYPAYGRTLTPSDPFLSIVQWASESADPPPYAAAQADGPDAPHVLMFQGIVDSYILPPMANAMSLSLGLDLGGEELDRIDPELEAFEPLGDLLELLGSEVLQLPVRGNRPGRTAVVVQHEEDGVEDGHEVMYQLDLPKEQYRCFLAGLAAGELPEVGEGCPSSP
jgi:pimeloyl-ACP methyl ester carboxylesterase